MCLFPKNTLKQYVSASDSFEAKLLAPTDEGHHVRGVVLEQGARLALHLVVCRRPSPFFFLLSSFFILGIFVRVAESNPFFTLP
jgi:hypothetical protein